MKLISLQSNHESFHSVEFKEGLNIVVGKKKSSQKNNEGNTFNGVGKSLILHLIHFCLGSNKIDSFSEQLPEWEFTLKFKICDTIYTTTRNTTNQSIIQFSGKEYTLKKYRTELLFLCFGIENNPKYMTWNSLFSRFIRRYRACYLSYDSFTPKENDYSKLLNNCYLLNIDTNLIINKKELREKQLNTTKISMAIKKDPFFTQYYCGNYDAEIDIDDLDNKINELESQISNFKISNNYHDLEKEADNISYEKKILENKRVLINSYIKNIEESLKQSAKVKEDDLFSTYKSANIEIPNMIKKDIDEVLNFHRDLLESRKIRLYKEKEKNLIELKIIDDKIYSLGQRMDELLLLLNDYGALDEYSSLTKQLSSLKSKFSRIQEYQQILKSYNDAKLDIKYSLLEENKMAFEYIESYENYLKILRETFSTYAKKFYPKKRSGLILKNNEGLNTLRYKLEARIQDDSSDGVNEVRMFCFDLLLLISKKSNMRFLAHDSRLFANMDPRQRKKVFEIMSEVCEKENLQYFCSINEDALLSFQPSMDEDMFDNIITKNIILELTDESSKSKLLGIQIDIDLEDKSKKKGDIN